MIKEYRHQGWSDDQFEAHHQALAAQGVEASRSALDTRSRLHQAALYRATAERQTAVPKEARPDTIAPEGTGEAPE